MAKEEKDMTVTRLENKLHADPKRVIMQFFNPGSEARIRNVISRIKSMSSEEAELQTESIKREFSGRHRNFSAKINDNYNSVSKYLGSNIDLPDQYKYLLGAYFSKEYSIEAAALFNPSIVPHPDQTGLNSGETRFVMSLRATGEGHISSVEFRTGVIEKDGSVKLDADSGYSELPVKTEKIIFNRKFIEDRIESTGKNYDELNLPQKFTAEEIEHVLEPLIKSGNIGDENKAFAEVLLDAVNTNYNITFDKTTEISERVIFPWSRSESVGMEDVRFVKFKNDDGSEKYYGTYTAYNGKSFRTQLIETEDFLTFGIRTLHGRAVKDKGMALFPRKVNGQYVMISRQGGENLQIMYSDNLYRWDNYELLQTPNEYWEYTQMGNGGSPLETDEGWLLITHSVGAFRRYYLGAYLLDKDDPSKIIGRLKKPLLATNEDEREGYVPNVLYTCGAMEHNGEIIIPYAMSDSACRFARAGIKELLDEMKGVNK